MNVNRESRNVTVLPKIETFELRYSLLFPKLPISWISEKKEDAKPGRKRPRGNREGGCGERGTRKRSWEGHRRRREKLKLKLGVWESGI